MSATEPGAHDLPVVRAADLAEPDETRRWLVEQLWTRSGVGIIGGAPKCCKSWLGLDLALSVASATPCLDTFAVTEPGGALLFLAEDAASVIRARLDGLCRHRGLDLAALPIDVITAPSLRLDLLRDQERLSETVRARKPRLLLLDPFVRLHRIDENHAGDVSGLLAYLRQLQRTFDVAVVVVHHARKNGPAGAQAGQGLRGSGDFHAWGDDNLYLRRHRDQLALSIEHRAASAPPPLRLALDDADASAVHLEIAADDAGTALTATSPDLDDAILRALSSATEPISRAALRAALRVRNERLGDALARLAAADRVVRRGDRWSSVPIPIPPTAQEAERNACAARTT